MLRKIDCVMIRVDDVEAAAAYYARVFGLHPQWSGDDAIGLIFPENDAEIVLHSYPDMPSSVEVHYLVDDVVAAVAHFALHGCQILVAPFDITIGKCAVIRDPFGTRLEEVPMFQHAGLFCNCDGRYCHKCGQMKCHRAFSKDRKGKFGLSSWCKECVKSNQQAKLDRINERRRENRRENADHYNAYNREYHHRNPEPKKARDQKYRQEHTEEINAYIRNYKRTNEAFKAKRQEYDREYRRLHPEQNAQNFNNRRARILQAGGSFTAREWKKLCKHYNYACLCCGRREPEIKLTADHVVPLSQGGTNSIDNIQPLCQSCNSSKHRKTIDYRVNWR